MTQQNIHGVNTTYRISGEGRWVVLLHGWGQHKDMMRMIEEHLNTGFKVLNIDFPGFGDSDEPPVPWGVEDYADYLDDLFKAVGCSDPILIGHSFGCRVAIRYAVKHPVHKMVLTGAAGIRPKRGLDYTVKKSVLSFGKKILDMSGNKDLEENLKKRMGSDDYRNATGVMRETFVKVVNDDVTDILDQVRCPVLLVFGDQDTDTPLWMGLLMEKKMPDAGLAVFQGDDHYAYFHQWQRFNAVLDAFFGEERS